MSVPIKCPYCRKVSETSLVWMRPGVRAAAPPSLEAAAPPPLLRPASCRLVFGQQFQLQVVQRLAARTQQFHSKLSQLFGERLDLQIRLR